MTSRPSDGSAGTSGQAGDPTGRDLPRRHLLQAAGGVGAGLVGGLGIPTGTAGAFAAKGALRPVSMAMHIHSSFSEGAGSMDAHLFQARRTGVDVVWWTEHDFRKMAFGYRDEIRFDGEHEPDGRWDFSWEPHTQGPVAHGEHDFVATPVNAAEAGNKLQLVADGTARDRWGMYVVQARAQNRLYSTSYSDTTVEMDIHPELLSANAVAVVEVISSYRPPSGGRPAGQYRLQYRIGEPTGRRTEDRGRLGVIGLASPPAGQWTRLRLDLRADHAALWPDTVADDASLWRLNLGIRVRRGATGRVTFDRLRFVRDRDSGGDPLALQQRAVDAYRSRYPSIQQYAAAEISLVMHLNSFGGDGVLPTYAREQAVKDPSVAAQREMIAFLRDHGQTVCINHPMSGSGGPAHLIRRLVSGDGLGAHVVEVGVGGRAMPNMIRVFDTLARNGVLITANGSTDDHRGDDWLGPGRRWVTGVWSPSTQEGDLCRALRAGRAWFYDPARWDGALDLRVEDTAMGGVLFTRKRRVDVVVRAEGLPKGSRVRLVTGRCDFAGPDVARPANQASPIARSQFRHGRWRGTVERDRGVYVRVEVRRGGHLIAFSNPVWVLPPHRRADIDVPLLRR